MSWRHRDMRRNNQYDHEEVRHWEISAFGTDPEMQGIAHDQTLKGRWEIGEVAVSENIVLTKERPQGPKLEKDTQDTHNLVVASRTWLRIQHGISPRFIERDLDDMWADKDWNRIWDNPIKWHEGEDQDGQKFSYPFPSLVGAIIQRNGQWDGDDYFAMVITEDRRYLVMYACCDECGWDCSEGGMSTVWNSLEDAWNLGMTQHHRNRMLQKEELEIK